MTELVKWDPPPPVGMSRDEAYALLGLMAVAWPNAKLTVEALTTVWVPRLVECDATKARLALEELIDTEHFPPSVARFREVYLEVSNRIRLNAIPRSVLQAPPASPETARKWRAKIVAQLREAKGPLARPLIDAMPRLDQRYFEPDAVETSATDNASQP